MEYPEPTLLVVDDTEDNLDLLEFALKRKPIKMLRASSGRQCLAIAQEKNPDVILLDIQMPEMDGFETLMHLRANPVTTRIPVIFLTAQRKDANSIEQGLELGADEYLTKPIDTEELLVRTKMLVRVKRAESELERTKADFMAMLVHDLRSPLNGIKSVIDFYREIRDQGKQFSPEQLGLLDTAGDSARRMLELINDILDLSKFEAGNMTLDKQKIDVSIILDTVCRETGLQFKQKNISLVKQYGEKLPAVFVDAEKIAQVTMNLLSNAMKFTKSGGTVTIATSLESGDAGRRFREKAVRQSERHRYRRRNCGRGNSTALRALQTSLFRKKDKTERNGTGPFHLQADCSIARREDERGKRSREVHNVSFHSAR